MLKIKLNETDSSFELTEESVRSLLDRLNLVIDNKWYDGNKSRPVFDCHDKFDELGETVCVFVEPPYEARVWYKDLNPRVNHYTEGIETLDELEEVLREFFKISPNESKQNERSSEDYLQEIYDSLASAWDKSKFNLSKGYDPDYDCQCIRISLKEDPAFYSLTYVIEPGDANFVSGRPTAFQTIWRYPNDHGVGVGETLEFQSTDFDDYGIEVFDYFDEIQKLSARKTSVESKQDEADYSASRVSKPIADAYSLLDEYFCDEDGRLTSDAVDKVYLTFRNERDLYDRSKSRAVKSHSLAWDALLREINATLEWDDENPHATSLTSEQVKNWFKLKGRDYKEELKPLVAVIDAYRNREY